MMLKTSEEKITELCSSLGRMVDGKYIVTDDCKINFDDLALSIWKEDATEKNISIHIYNLNAFEEHFIHLLSSENEEISFIALKALAACTYPYPSTVTMPEKIAEIYQHYKFVLVNNKAVIFTALTFLLNIIENPRAAIIDFQKAEVCFTFIRNIAIIKSSTDVDECLFNILEDGGLFDIIAELQMKSFASRIPKFAPIIAGILYGCFSPFMPLVARKAEPKEKELTIDNVEEPPKPTKKNDPFLDSILADLNKEKKRKPSRHGHWGSTLVIKTKKNEGYTYTGPINQDVIKSAPLPRAIIKPRTRARLFEQRPHGIEFTRKAEAAAAKILWSQSFDAVYKHVLPRTFSAYDRVTTVTQQLQMADLTRFFIDFILLYGGELKAKPLATPDLVKYFLTMANWYVEQKTPDLEGITIEVALHKICMLFSSMSTYFISIIKFAKEEEEVNIVKDSVSEFSKDIENFVVNLLCKKFKTKATLNMLQDTIVALEKLYKLYSVAEDERLTRRLSQKEDLSTIPNMDLVTDLYAEYEDFTAETIILRLVGRQGVLIPFFQCIKNYEKLNDEELDSISAMLNRFSKYRMGLAHIFKLPYFIIIDKLLNDDAFVQSDDKHVIALKEALELILEKFFYNTSRESSVYLSCLIGPDDSDLYDQRRDELLSQEAFYDELGISQKERNALEGKPYNSESDQSDSPQPTPTKKKTTKPSKQKRKLVSASQTQVDENDNEALLSDEESNQIPEESNDSLSEENDEMPVAISDNFSDENETATMVEASKDDSSDSDTMMTPAEVIKQMAILKAKNLK